MTHANPEQFNLEKHNRVIKYAEDAIFVNQANEFLIECIHKKHSYNFNWLGLPIIQFPEDIVAMQEIVFMIQPDVIVETGVARGGSLVFFASLLKLLNKKKVIGVDVLILDFNRKAIEDHFLNENILLIEGDSTSNKVLSSVKMQIDASDKVLVCLDSNHSEEHVYRELKQYSNLVTVGSYLVVFDSTVENFSSKQVNELKNQYHILDWDKGNNPGSAVVKFLREDPRFVLDDFFNSRSLISNCRGGYLRRVS
jgi:cephalosporin hydroxylase